ncbi:MAG: hypothetical protein ACSLFO_04405 [Acidimicrobiales bacterium]
MASLPDRIVALHDAVEGSRSRRPSNSFIASVGALLGGDNRTEFFDHVADAIPRV